MLSAGAPMNIKENREDDDEVYETLINMMVCIVMVMIMVMMIL